MWTLIEWLLEWAVGKGADAALGSLKGSGSFQQLAGELETELREWEAEVREKYPDFYADPLFKWQDRGGDAATHQSVLRLWEDFREGETPSRETWLDALLACWRHVSHVIEESGRQEFYTLTADDALPWLEKLSVRLQQASARNADFFRTSSDLFQRRAEEQLDEIRENVKQVRQLLGRDSQHQLAQALRQLRRIDQTLRRRERLAGPLRALYEGIETHCREVDRPVYTSDVLEALLKSPDGIALRCFDELQAGLGQQVLGQLAHFNRQLGDDAPFLDFDWEERPESGPAAQYANDENSPKIQHKHLLLAILQGDSQTAAGLGNELGQPRASQLVQQVKATPTVWLEHFATPDAGPFG